MKIKERIVRFLGTGTKSIVVSARELTIRMFGISYTKANLSSVEYALRSLHANGVLEKCERYSPFVGKTVNKFYLKGEHPRW